MAGMTASETATGTAAGPMGDAPGPGMWPFIISIAMLVFGVVLLVRPEPDAVEPIDRNIVLVSSYSSKPEKGPLFPHRACRLASRRSWGRS